MRVFQILLYKVLYIVGSSLQSTVSLNRLLTESVISGFFSIQENGEVGSIYTIYTVCFLTMKQPQAKADLLKLKNTYSVGKYIPNEKAFGGHTP